jgi:glutamate-1-semialdehyde 2,1-aminomutase
MIMSLNYTDEDFNQVITRMVNAAQKMNNDGWWWQSPELTNKSIQKQMLLDMLAARFPVFASFAQPLNKNTTSRTTSNTIREGQ